MKLSLAVYSRRLQYILALLAIGFALGCVNTASMPVAHADTSPPPPATAKSECEKTAFLGLAPWYQYLTVVKVKSQNGAQGFTCKVCFSVFAESNGDPDCTGANANKSGLLLVGLAIVDDLLRIAGLVAVGYIIYAAINFITSQGNPEDAAKARGTAINALIGLVIALVAIAFVSFAGAKLGG